MLTSGRGIVAVTVLSRLAVQKKNRGFSSGAEGKAFFFLKAGLLRCAGLRHSGGCEAAGELQLGYEDTMNEGLFTYVPICGTFN